MIQCFTKGTPALPFSKDNSPHLLSASYITNDFSQHARILHNHDDRLELLLIRSGTGSYIVDDECYEISAGNIVVCNAGILHDELAQTNRDLNMLSLAIDQLRLKGLPENHLIPSNIKPILKMEKHFQLLETMFQSIFDFLSSEEQPDTIYYLTQSLLSLLIHIFENNGEPLSEGTVEHPVLKEIKAYIDENYSEELSLQSISDHFYISSSYLSHLFKKNMGYSPMHYIIRRRIGEAQTLLITTDMPVTEIASAVGFDNLSHFNVQFKKFVGLSPSTYRKKYILPEYDKNLDSSHP